MAEMDENDIIIKISTYLRNVGSNRENREQFSVDYSTLDNAIKLPQGSAAKHLEEAAKDAGLEVIRKGATMASFRHPPNKPMIG
jgi:hypothetical protein